MGVLLVSSHFIRLLGALKAKRASPALGRFFWGLRVATVSLGASCGPRSSLTRLLPLRAALTRTAPLRLPRGLDRACGGELRRGCLSKGVTRMLHIYPVILAFVTDVHPFIERIGRHDPDLAKQLRRASASVVLNTAEGMYARGRQRTASYNIALREMRESYAALEVAVRLRYIAPLPDAFEDRIERIIGTLVRLSFPRQRAG